MKAGLPLVVAALGASLLLSHCAGGGGGGGGTSGGYEITKSSAAKSQLQSYQTFAWSSKRVLSLQDPSRDTQAVQARIMALVDRELEGKGLSKTSPSQADLLVSYEAIARETVAVEATDAEVVASDDAGDTVEADVEVLEVQESVEGSLTVDLRDRRSGKDVYRSSAETALLDDPSPWKAETQLQSTVSRMLGDFPRRQ
jgi:hypothetical protein